MKLPPLFDKDNTLINVVIETPRGSRNKYVYDPEHDFFQLKKILPFGTVFPFDFGFIPWTLGEDGQPLDILLLMDDPSFPGCVVKCRCLGVIMAEQTEKRKKFRNDRIIAVPAESLTYADTHTIGDLSKNVLREFIHFFEYYNSMEGKKFKFLRLNDARVAMSLIRKHMIKET